jgi:hypothetical protein
VVECRLVACDRIILAVNNYIVNMVMNITLPKKKTGNFLTSKINITDKDKSCNSYCILLHSFATYNLSHMLHENS